VTPIEIGYHVFLEGTLEEVGAVRDVSTDGLVIWVENAGDVTIPLDAIVTVTSQKVILEPAKLDDRLLDVIGHAHEAEEPGV
jgi:hypothetical protein